MVNKPPIINVCGKSIIPRVVVSQREHKTYVYDNNGKLIKSFPNATGKKSTPTTPGIRKITGIEQYPYTGATGTKRKQNPNDYGPFVITNNIIDPNTGKHKITGEFLHGTSHPESIGNYASGGCVRHNNKIIPELVKLVEPGDFVFIQP
jgi:L,D-transpeptidase YnhG